MTAASVADSVRASVAVSLMLDHVAAVTSSRLADAGIPAILLKGAAIATWLYTEGEARPYRDVDLLVSPAQFDQAQTVLAGLGYVNPLAGAANCEYGSNELRLVGRMGDSIDLHHALIGVPEPARAWQCLYSRSTTLAVGGAELRVLDVEARAMHLALHAMQDGPIDVKAMEDLARGVARLPLATWKGAAGLAAELGAMGPFGAGLRLFPAGAALAEQLGLPDVVNVDLTMRARSDPPEAFLMEQLAGLPDFRARAALLGRKLFPTTVYLKSQYPMAARGPLGVTAARFCRLGSLALRTVPAMVAWRRARRHVRRQAGATPAAGGPPGRSR